MVPVSKPKLLSTVPLRPRQYTYNAVIKKSIQDQGDSVERKHAKPPCPERAVNIQTPLHLEDFHWLQVFRVGMTVRPLRLLTYLVLPLLPLIRQWLKIGPISLTCLRTRPSLEGSSTPREYPLLSLDYVRELRKNNQPQMPLYIMM